MSAVWHPLHFSLSADGRRLAFHLDFRGGPNRHGIWIYDLETATAVRILPEQPLRYFDQVAWSDEGDASWSWRDDPESSSKARSTSGPSCQGSAPCPDGLSPRRRRLRIRHPSRAANSALTGAF